MVKSAGRASHGGNGGLLCIPRHVRHKSGLKDKVKHDDCIQILGRDALLMALNKITARLQVDYPLSNMTGYEMLHSCTIHVIPKIVSSPSALLLGSSTDRGELDLEEQQSPAPLIFLLIWMCVYTVCVCFCVSKCRPAVLLIKPVLCGD